MNNNQDLNNLTNPNPVPNPTQDLNNLTNPNVVVNPTQVVPPEAPAPQPVNPQPTEPAPAPQPAAPQNQAPNAGLNSMNVDGTYNRLEAPSYVNDPQIKENVKQGQKKTVTVSKELKTVIVIAIILLIFIIVLPMLFDIVGKISYQ